MDKYGSTHNVGPCGKVNNSDQAISIQGCAVRITCIQVCNFCMQVFLENINLPFYLNGWRAIEIADTNSGIFRSWFAAEMPDVI